MSINEMDRKIKELRELRRMAEELVRQFYAMRDFIRERAKFRRVIC